MAKKKNKTGAFSTGKRTALKESPDAGVADVEKAAERFVGQWNRLVSTTNWEKGRIICQWREALMTSGAAVTEYSDEAWSQLVGGVTSQHVGRLRHVSQRFDADHDQYEGLYWSHFQAALEWDDAEMWLEGAIHNDWSVSQMRGKHWETLGTPPEQQQAEIAADQLIFEPESQATSTSGESASACRIEDAVAGQDSVASSTPTLPKSTVAKEVAAAEEKKSASKDVAVKSSAAPAAEPSKRAHLKINVEDLPDDLAEAFESFKLAIISHRREGWTETTPAEVVKCLDALRELALAE